MKNFFLALLLAGSLVPVLHAADKSDEMPPPKIKVGDMAPDFTLQDQNGNKVSLHEFPRQEERRARLLHLRFHRWLSETDAGFPGEP